MAREESKLGSPINALIPRGHGHQFVCYADACSGVPGELHEQTFTRVNSVVARFRPQPEFICFPGDEIQGLTTNETTLREQWRYWFEQEMSWLNQQVIPLYHTTGNHTTYDSASESVFRDVLSYLPHNGPAGQEGLSYFVRRDDLLLVFVNTLWSGLGGEGRVETRWLDQTLTDHADARHKLVIGHHPAFPVNGFSGPYQREMAPDNAREFWQVLVRHNVTAYLCSHILAFDVQVHQGILQITTAGAGTAHRMPEESEYLHCVQLALDDTGLRYQVLDDEGCLREWLTWPLRLARSDDWPRFQTGATLRRLRPTAVHSQANLVVWRCGGVAAEQTRGEPQTIIAGWDSGPGLSTLWIGLLGPEQRLGVLLSPQAGRSPHLWHGPTFPASEPFSFQIGIHTGMGPGGILWRSDDEAPWSTLSAASPWGAERLTWPSQWGVSHDKRGPHDRPFRGAGFEVSWTSAELELEIP